MSVEFELTLNRHILNQIETTPASQESWNFTFFLLFSSILRWRRSHFGWQCMDRLFRTYLLLRHPLYVLTYALEYTCEASFLMDFNATHAVCFLLKFRFDLFITPCLASILLPICFSFGCCCCWCCYFGTHGALLRQLTCDKQSSCHIN